MVDITASQDSRSIGTAEGIALYPAHPLLPHQVSLLRLQHVRGHPIAASILPGSAADGGQPVGAGARRA